MEPIILYRAASTDKEEVVAMQKHFATTPNRTNCKNQLVIPRYSCLPYYRELEEDLKHNNCEIINTYRQHQWIANFDYYYDLKEYTPETWDFSNFYKSDYQGPFVVKGRTNSRKHQWNSLMFAETRDRAIHIACELGNDGLICDQEIIFRKYIPLKTFEVGLNGMRFANEWRCFYYKTQRLTCGYYWSTADDLASPYITKQGLDLADKIAEVAAQHVNFFVLDVAETESGDWILIEINDGSMSGLSENDPNVLYENLHKELMNDVRIG